MGVGHVIFSLHLGMVTSFVPNGRGVSFLNVSAHPPSPSPSQNFLESPC